ncbi:MAG: cob(I)yrinic acid a,c-diamide adenosyltransferase [Deltaproteobacteria bacterium]|nr:cob(I)yrinic acid a,c-diamide adenosyltransferase [Deltaproteobacteria bacterium]
MSSGHIRVYTGDGKGKTTSALGEALNTLCANKCVCVFQFMKPALRRGEELLINWFPHDLVFLPVGKPGFIHSHKVSDPSVPRHTLDMIKAERALRFAREVMHGEQYHLMILDEINMAIYFQMIPLKEVLSLIDDKPPGMNLVLTGQKAHPEVMKRAHQVIEIRNVRHYYNQGVQARMGIEY